MRQGRKLKIIIPILFCIFWGNSSAFANGFIEILDPQVIFSFGEIIEFHARLENQQSVTAIEVFFRPVDGPTTYVGAAEIEDDSITYIHEVVNNFDTIPVFSTVEYRFRITYQNGESALSDVFYFDYFDNRFAWQSLDDMPFRVHWVKGDLAFGQEVLDSARTGLKRINNLLEFPDLQWMDIYVYPSSIDLQSALQLSGLTLVAGHANPELGLVLVSLPAGPTQRLEIQRQVPHEIMHIMLFQKYGSRYENFPTWISEGLASLVEANPDPDYFILIQDAIENQSLLPFESLCSGFRMEASLFYLSYAQSESFTRYLYENFGASGMTDLLDRYADGVECTRAPQLVYGQTLARLEDRWYQALVGETNWWGSMEPLIPWFVLLGLVLIAPLLLVLGSMKSVRQKLPVEGKIPDA